MLNHSQPENRPASKGTTKCSNQSEGSSAILHQLPVVKTVLWDVQYKALTDKTFSLSLPVAMWGDRQTHSVTGAITVKKKRNLQIFAFRPKISGKSSRVEFHVHLRHNRNAGPLTQHSVC